MVARGEAIIGRSPDITTESGRKFWVYGPDEQLPATCRASKLYPEKSAAWSTFPEGKRVVIPAPA
jgi:hypothetical protein